MSRHRRREDRRFGRYILLTATLLAVSSSAVAERVKLTVVPAGDERDPAVREAFLRQDLRSLREVRRSGLEDAELTLDTVHNVLEYRFGRAGEKRVAPQQILLHGFGPVGWRTKAITRLELDHDGNGRWKFDEEQEENLLAGLAYLTVGPDDDGNPDRLRLVPPLEPSVRFPDTLAALRMAGTCHLRLELFDVLDETEVDMDAAQVAILRSPPGDVDDDSFRETQLAVDVRIGGGYVPGLGPIEVQMLDTFNPGMVEANGKEADFPARMTLDLRKRYITPVGTFISERESYAAPAIYSFPPYGAELKPVTPVVRLLDEKTHRHVGNLYPGTIVPLFALDARSFPSRRVTVPQPVFSLDPFPEVKERPTRPQGFSRPSADEEDADGKR